MTDAFIYDHVRTPRGRGKPDGALHEVTALDLATHALAAPAPVRAIRTWMIPWHALRLQRIASTSCCLW
jgi:acetyl-CoA C-acetyltransferase